MKVINLQGEIDNFLIRKYNKTLENQGLFLKWSLSTGCLEILKD